MSGESGRKEQKILTINEYQAMKSSEVNSEKTPKLSGIETAKYYLTVMETEKIRSRAELARFMGVSRARVTQVLSRLN